MSEDLEHGKVNLVHLVLLVHPVDLAHREPLLGGKEADIPFKTSY